MNLTRLPLRLALVPFIGLIALEAGPALALEVLGVLDELSQPRALARVEADLGEPVDGRLVLGVPGRLERLHPLEHRLDVGDGHRERARGQAGEDELALFRVAVAQGRTRPRSRRRSYCC